MSCSTELSTNFCYNLEARTISMITSLFIANQANPLILIITPPPPHPPPPPPPHFDFINGKSGDDFCVGYTCEDEEMTQEEHTKITIGVENHLIQDTYASLDGINPMSYSQIKQKTKKLIDTGSAPSFSQENERA